MVTGFEPELTPEPELEPLDEPEFEPDLELEPEFPLELEEVEPELVPESEPALLEPDGMEALGELLWAKVVRLVPQPVNAMKAVVTTNGNV